MISSNNNSIKVCEVSSMISIKATNHEPEYSRFGRRSNEASQVVSKRKPHHKTDNTLKQKNKQNIINIGTWNVRTMLRAGKLEEVKNIMIEKNIDILGLCETRWQGSNDFNSDEFRIITSGGDVQGQRGVALVMKKKWAKKDYLISVISTI